MLIKAEQRNSRQSPRKVRLVADAIRKLTIPKAIDQLGLMDQKGSVVVLKVLHQAVANATKNHGLKVEDLVIKEVIVNEGPQYKRFRAVSRGRAHNIIKKTCHVRITLEAKNVEAPIAAKAEKAVASTVVEEAQVEKVEKKAAKPKAKKTVAAKKETKKTDK